MNQLDLNIAIIQANQILATLVSERETLKKLSWHQQQPQLGIVNALINTFQAHINDLERILEKVKQHEKT